MSPRICHEPFSQKDQLVAGTAQYNSGLLLTLIGVLAMSKMTPEEKEEYRKAIAKSVIKSASKEYGGSESLKHWRAWGSWFNWGSPVGLGLFLVEAAVAIWIFFQIF